MDTRRRIVFCASLIALILSLCSSVRGQTSATTGAIIGTVTDNSGAVMAGAKVTVTGPALMSDRTVVTDSKGEYQVPVLPPGVYRLVFDATGFGSVTDEGINISVGFTATVNATMKLASVSQTVEVTSVSPVVDATSTKISTDLSAAQIQNLPSKQDYGSILEITPGVTVTKPNVGGSGAIAFAVGGTRYGISGQSRSEMEGIDTTESGNTGGEYIYTDQHIFQDVTLNVIGNNAEMPTPGTLTQMVAKSGGNSYHGQVSELFENHVMETTNIDARQLALGVTGTLAFPAVDTNRLQELSDFSGNVGGYVLKNKLWWFGEYGYTRFVVNFTNLVGASQVSTLPVYAGKISYNLTAKNKLSVFYMEGIKHQNPGLYGAVVFPLSSGRDERWSSNVRQGEWDSILSNSVVLQVRGGLFFERGDYFPNDAKDLLYSDIGLNTQIGDGGLSLSTHYNWQINGLLSYYKTGLLGTHNFKFGSEFYRESNGSFNSFLNNMKMILSNGAPAQVVLYQQPTSSTSALRAFSMYAQDSWQVVPRLTLNLGVRFDQYLPFTPAQTAPTGTAFPRINAPLWNNVAPRIGGVYALTRDRKTLLKASFGQYWEDPFGGLAQQFNPNLTTSSTYAWTPSTYPTTAVDGVTVPVFVPGTQGKLLSSTGTNPNGTPAVTVDPNLTNSYSLQATAFLERELAPNFGVRTGFVWNAWRQPYGEVNTNQPYSAFDVPVTIQVPGPDGNLSDSTGTVTAYNLDPAYVSLPLHQVIASLPSAVGNSNYYNWEITANRRMTGRWSLMASYVETWANESPVTDFTSLTLSASGAGGVPPPYYTPTIINPNTQINTFGGQSHYTNWASKVTGAFDVWRGFKLDPSLRSQSGLPFARTFNQKLNYTSAAQIMAEKWGAERLPVINIVDVRIEKAFTLKERWKINLFFDVYNIFNSNAAQTATISSGAAFLRPTSITGPRIAGFGANFNF